jgi:HEAT repeat protein
MMIDRYDALVAMREHPWTVKRQLLAERFAREPFYAIRAEIASQCASDPESLPLLRAALTDPAVQVRRSALDALSAIPEDLRETVESLLRDSSYAITAKALRMIAAQYPDRTRMALEATRGVGGIGDQVRVLWHEIRGEMGDQASLDSLVDLAGPSYGFRTRVNSFEALRRLHHSPPSLLPPLFDALVHPNGRLRGPATEVAASFMQESSLRRAYLAYYRSRSWAPWQRAMLEEVFR